jgi:hypothetical protein
MFELLMNAPALMDASATTVTGIDLSGVDFSGLVKTIQEMVPTVIGVIVPLAAIRKGIGFLVGSIRGA